MGRIRNKFIKRNTRAILDIHSDKFTNDFKKNKNAMVSAAKTVSKKIRNRIAGYITFIKKKGISLRKVE
ncbi:30S ribosomal protein S17e [Candidatus Tiddalikarchaeum anstoanum]|nr:30S ribosomal protein S17e [Candidatus Tiddalikarchaeum anstoanum]